MDEQPTTNDILTAPLALEYIKSNGGCTLFISGDIQTRESEDVSAHTSGTADDVAMMHGED